MKKPQMMMTLRMMMKKLQMMSLRMMMKMTTAGRISATGPPAQCHCRRSCRTRIFFLKQPMIQRKFGSIIQILFYFL